MIRFSNAAVAELVRGIGIDLPPDWTGVDALLPVLERMREDGATLLLKWDGGRDPDVGEGPYTAVVQGGPLGDDFFRTDAVSLDAALCHVIGSYARAVWSDA